MNTLDYCFVHSRYHVHCNARGADRTRMGYSRNDPPAISPRDPTTGDSLPVSGDWAMFLDVDGTLLHIAETPGGVEVSDHLRDVLARLAPAMGQALALVSGRPIATLDHFFSPLLLPAAGLHGLEFRSPTGEIRSLGDPLLLEPLRPALAAFADAHPGVIYEDKRRTLALHYRRAPAAAEAARRLVRELTGRYGKGLHVVDGKMVLEIKPRLTDKGAAVEAFLREAPFHGRLPVFIGDDVTDEDAFQVVNDLGGHSIRVGVGQDTRARYRLPDVDAVIGWLEVVALRAADYRGGAGA